MSKSKSTAYPISDHYDGTYFFNPGLHIKKSFKNVLQMMKERRKENKWPQQVENKATPVLAPVLPSNLAYITYVNHATHLIQFKDINILTDPIFSKVAGPLPFLGPKRVRKPGLQLKELPKIDVVLVSHNHYDHMDMPTLKQLEKMFQPIFIVPIGNKKYLPTKKFHHVIELDWWQTLELNETQSITLVPAQHWSMRRFSDANKSLWGGFWIQAAKIKLYFAGDSGYGPHFKAIHQNLGAPDISILPIGSYEPRWFMKEQHMNPEEAVLASLDLNSRFSIATHHQTFRLSLEHIHDPVKNLKHSMQTHKVNSEDFLAPETGETVMYSHSKQTLQPLT